MKLLAPSNIDLVSDTLATFHLEMLLLKFRWPLNSLLVLVTPYMIHSLIGPYFVLAVLRSQHQAFAARWISSSLLISLCTRHSHQFAPQASKLETHLHVHKHRFPWPRFDKCFVLASCLENNPPYPAIAVATGQIPQVGAQRTLLEAAVAVGTSRLFSLDPRESETVRQSESADIHKKRERHL